MLNVLLEMVETNGVFVPGNDRTTYAALVGALEQVSVQVPTVRGLAGGGKRAIERLKDRFVSVLGHGDAPQGAQPCDCPNLQCVAVVDLSVQDPGSAAVRTCPSCKAKIVPLSHILHAKETEGLRKPAQLFVDSTWTHDNFEARVWQPLFRFSTKAEVFDRQIYRSEEHTSELQSH